MEVVRSKVSDVGWELGRHGGSALCFGLVRETERARLALTIGAATRRGVPGAGRVHIGGRSPLTGGYTEGAVGGDLAWALAAGGLAGLWIEGRARDAVLIVDVRAGDVQVTLRAVDDVLEGAGALGAGALARGLAQACGPADELGVLANGPGARRGVPYGLLVSGDAVASVTGRGGLGTLLAELGCWALVVRVFGQRAEAAGGRWLAQAAAHSPRLRARARSGTFELFAAFAARGDARREVSGWGRQARERETEHHGCKGCPTPCGMVFDRGDGARGGARFGAAHALGEGLGLTRFEDVLRLLAACDHQGVDAREAAGVLALLAGGGSAGDVDALCAALAHLPPRGLAELAEDTGAAHRVVVAGGQSARREVDIAATLGQVVATAGNDPMRSFPFTVARAVDAPQAPADAAPWSPLAGVEPEVLDPTAPTGKGRLVAWHEDLAAAIDIAGFCSFSAAGLLVDGALTLDELARLVAPAEVGDDPAPGRAWLRAGRALVLARRAFALAHRGPQELPDWARAQLAQPGVLDAYLAERGEAARAAELGLGAVVRAPRVELGPGGAGAVELRFHGALAEAVGADVVPLDVEGSLPMVELAARCAARWPAASALLVGADGRLVPAVWRAGALVGARALVHAGDELEFVLVIGGG